MGMVKPREGDWTPTGSGGDCHETYMEYMVWTIAKKIDKNIGYEKF